MWQERSRVDEILEFVCQAERAGIVKIGRGDIFVESQDFRLTLCHEGDAHVGGTADLVHEVIERWEQLSCQPYEVKQQP